MCGFGGNIPPAPKGTLTPLIPLSLIGPKGEGERGTEAGVGATHPRLPLVQYWGEGTGRSEKQGIYLRQHLPLVLHWGRWGWFSSEGAIQVLAWVGCRVPLVGTPIGEGDAPGPSGKPSRPNSWISGFVDCPKPLC